VPAGHLLHRDAKPLGNHAALDLEWEEAVVTTLEEPGGDLGPGRERPGLAEEVSKREAGSPIACSTTSGGTSLKNASRGSNSAGSSRPTRA
jgi:hypothetical protein